MKNNNKEKNNKIDDVMKIEMNNTKKEIESMKNERSKAHNKIDIMKTEMDKINIGIYEDEIDIHQQIESLESYIKQQKMMENFRRQQVDNQRYETKSNIKPVSSLESTTKSLKENQDFIQVLEKRLLLLKEKVNIEKNYDSNVKKEEPKVDIEKNDNNKEIEIKDVILNNEIEKINVNNEEDLVKVYNQIIDSQFADYKFYLEKQLENPIIKKALNFKNEENQLRNELEKLLSNLEKEKQFKAEKDQEIDKITQRQIEIEKLKEQLGGKKLDEDIEKEYKNNIIAIKKYIGHTKIYDNILVDLENKIQKTNKALDNVRNYIDVTKLNKKQRDISKTRDEDLKQLMELKLLIENIDKSRESIEDQEDLEDLNNHLSAKRATVEKLQQEIERQELELLQIKEELKTAKEIESALPKIKKIQSELALIERYEGLNDEQKNDVENGAMIHYGLTEEQLDSYKFSTADEKYNLIHREEIAAEKLRNEERQKQIEEHNKIIAAERKKQEEEIRQKQEEERKLKEEERKKEEEKRKKEEEIKKAVEVQLKREKVLKEQKNIEYALRKAQQEEAKEKAKAENKAMIERIIKRKNQVVDQKMNEEVERFYINNAVYNASVGNFETVREIIANSNKKLSSIILAAKDPLELYKAVVGDSKLCKLYVKMIVPTEKLKLKISMYNAQLEAASATSNKEKREKLLKANDIAEFGKICADRKGYGATMDVYKKFLKKYLPKHENMSLDANSKYYFVQALRLLVKENKKETQLALLNVHDKNSYDIAVDAIHQEKNELKYNPDSGLKEFFRRMIGSN